jgi:hypothetical protein
MTPNARDVRLKMSTPLILVSTTVFKFFVFDHENSQIKKKKCLPLRESVTGTTTFFLFGLVWNIEIDSLPFILLNSVEYEARY